MRCSFVHVATVLLALSANIHAATFSFLTDPFAGSNATVTPGRQIVGGEAFITFETSTDVFELFDIGGGVLFANDIAANLPTSGVNVIVLESFDNDADPATPFAAGTAANLIAAQITTPGPGFFIYFNQGLDLPRLVFSTDLNDNTADLKILFRMTNLAGNSGALSSFTAANFVMTPEPSTFVLMSAAGLFWACGYIVRRRRTRGHPAK